MPPHRLQTRREGLYLRTEIEPNQRPSQSFQSLRRYHAQPASVIAPRRRGESVMTAAAAIKQTQVPLSNKAREMMEAINTDAAQHHVWVRTQANAPAQRPWFSETSGEGSGQLASGRVAVAQMKTLPYMW